MKLPSARQTTVNRYRFPNAVGPGQTDAPAYFLHIPKTAGSTLGAFLQTLFFDSEFWHRGGRPDWERLLTLTHEELRQCQVINGHFAGYLFKHYPLPLRYFSFLRDPLERAVSHYAHVLRNPAHYFHALAHELGSFGAYLRDERTQPTVANFQLRSIAATFDPVAVARTLSAEQMAKRELEKHLDTMPLGQSLEKLLQIAQVRLDQMCFVGLTERFDESLSLLCEVFVWPRPATTEARNVNPRPTPVKTLPTTDARLLKRLNEADIELYQFAKGRFERDWARSRFVYPHLHAFVSYAQNAEDVLLHRALRDVSHGTYIDVGANDSAGDSVTKAFYDRGWQGINLEPVGSLYEALVRERPRDINIQAAAGAADARKTLYEIPGTGLSTLDARIANRHRTQGFRVNETTIRVCTLNFILSGAHLPQVHFLKIDVEGWEKEVLLGIDLSVTRPWIIVVEATEPNTEIPSYGEWEPILLEKQYEFVFFDGLNRYYVARERRRLKKAFSRPVNSGDVFIKSSEASALRDLREAQWRTRRQSVLLRERDCCIAEAGKYARSLEERTTALERERNELIQGLTTQVNARAADQNEAVRQIEALTQWAKSADTYAKSMVSECEGLRGFLKAESDARGTERADAVRQIEALTQWATSADVYGKSLVGECEKLRASLKAVSDARDAERADAILQIEALTHRATSAEVHGESLVSECERLIACAKAISDARNAERVDAVVQIEALTQRAEKAEVHGKSLLAELEQLRAARVSDANALASLNAETSGRIADLMGLASNAESNSKALAAEVVEWRDKWQEEVDAGSADTASARREIQELTASVELVQRALEAECEGRALEQAKAKNRAEALGSRLETLEQDLAGALAREVQLKSALEREQAERRIAGAAASEERKSLESEVAVLTDRALRAEANVHGLTAVRETLLEERARSVADWETERNELTGSVAVLEGSVGALKRHWAVRLLVDRRYLPRTQVTKSSSRRKIGIFTIASKNYLAYVRVLFKSVAAVHPEYALYLCLADTVGGAFDPRSEGFETIESHRIGIPHFDDMTVRYDIMEFNTAIKPFMFRWLLDNTDLDSVIYLDPDIRVYSRLDRLEALLKSGVSIVLTPHITRPIEDGKNPNDYHMLQAGTFNLGFAAMNRCDEAKRFVEWWGRRLETQGYVDIARNLFTDQRWCDLAPSFVDRLRVFKDPGYNVAYWNLSERTIRNIGGEWQVNGEPLVFFHFSGINASDESLVSKHQNRFDWAALPTCKPLFDAYREALIREGWEQTKGWEYSYANTKEGLRVPSIVRQLYRERFPASQSFAGASATERLLELCNGPSEVLPHDVGGVITRLMESIYWRRPDVQAAFNMSTYEGRAALRAWYKSAALVEYGLPLEFIPENSMIEDSSRASATVCVIGESARHGHHDLAGALQNGHAAQAEMLSGANGESQSVGDAWNRLPDASKRLVARIVSRLPHLVGAQEVARSEVIEEMPEQEDFRPPMTGRIAALQRQANVRQLLEGRFISNLMYLIWSSRPDLKQAFDLETHVGQAGFTAWFEASAQREYGPGARSGGASERDDSQENGRGRWAATASRPGANLVGYANAELGMGEHVRMSAAALHSTSVDFGVVNFKVGLTTHQRAALEHGRIVSGNPYAANILHVNADQMLVAYCHLGEYFFANRYNIGYWAWELAKCPTEWQPVLNMVEEVWAPSRFIQRAFSERADIPVEYMPLCVVLPEFEQLNRAYFGLPEEAFTFLYTFDFLSFVDRKNPFAAVRAFKLAFPGKKPGVSLVLKIMNGKEDSPLWSKLMEVIDEDPRIVTINRTLTRAEVLALMDTSDCFVSLHRSEGFGRGPAEAMYLGKPVIVTNYSGNTDFTLMDNSCLVDFRLIQVEEGQYPFYKGQQWADADVEHAAWYMKKLYADSALGRELGARGRAYIRENFNQQTIGARYEARLRKLRLA